MLQKGTEFAMVKLRGSQTAMSKLYKENNFTPITFMIAHDKAADTTPIADR